MITASMRLDLECVACGAADTQLRLELDDMAEACPAIARRAIKDWGYVAPEVIHAEMIEADAQLERGPRAGVVTDGAHVEPEFHCNACGHTVRFPVTTVTLEAT